ncbi:MAG: tetratricopeptide repeat protein [Saprospiraceae bacterium]|nr:tetratricopeptide repeat protein [Saprospiraceae bacterium]
MPRKIAIAYTQVAIRQSNPDNILKYCEKAINKDKTYYLPFYQGAIALSTQGETTKAIKYLEESIALNPDFGEAYYHLGSEYLNIGRNELGKDYLKKALALNPEHLEARNKLVNLRSAILTLVSKK